LSQTFTEIHLHLMSPKKVFKGLSFGDTVFMGRAKGKRCFTTTAKHRFTVRV